MKVLYVDIAITGHHIPYFSALVSNENYESVLVLPQKVESVKSKQYECNVQLNGKLSFSTYLNWLKEIHNIVEKEKPDVIHFLTGDIMYRFFGFGLFLFRKQKTVLTLHRIKEGFLGRISTKIISKNASCIVLHSEYMKRYVEGLSANNITHIEYPVFNIDFCDKRMAQDYFSLKKDVPVIGCIGGTRYDKGLDILLEALNSVEKPFQLLVAGKAEYFDEVYIKEHIKGYKENVCLYLKFLSDEELKFAINAIDIVVLPYRKMFNGASGPLGEGVILGKCIIGPNHGNLRDTIEKNHLGYTFESENIVKLAETINRSLTSNFSLDDNYQQYKEQLNVSSFLQKYEDVYKA